MFRLLLILFLFGFCSMSSSKYQKKPTWIDEPPKSKVSDYYYRVTRAESTTYEKAYAKAFAICILESSWKLGVVVNTNNDVEHLSNEIIKSIDLKDNQMSLAINKKREYSEPLTKKRGVRIYILWQVASHGNVIPDFDN